VDLGLGLGFRVTPLLWAGKGYQSSGPEGQDHLLPVQRPGGHLLLRRQLDGLQIPSDQRQDHPE